MHTIHRSSRQSAIPAYSENAVLQLIIASGVTFIMYHFTRIIMLIVGVEQAQVFQWMVPNVSLPAIGNYMAKAWTILTYGWVHQGFWEWVTNMIWLFCFGSVLQSLAGFRQVIPLYILALLTGGAFYLAGQFIPIAGFHPGNTYFAGAGAAVTACGIAALALAPAHRMNIGISFSIPMVIVVAVYLLLNLIIVFSGDMPVLMIHAGGAAAGLLYAWRLKKGDRPGDYIYDVLNSVGRLGTPNEEKIKALRNKKRNEVMRKITHTPAGVGQHRIDEILDKINEHGYRSLTAEEKDILMRAGKE